MEESRCGLVMVLSWHLPRGAKENHTRTKKKKGHLVSQKIQTEHPLYTSLECYCSQTFLVPGSQYGGELNINAINFRNNKL